MAAVKTICFDLDGVLCTQTTGDYENAVPDPEAIAVVNDLFDQGFRIIINTSRFMGRTKGNSAEAYKHGYEFTRRQLAAWDVHYHELFLGKPVYDVVIDDRSLFWVRDWQAIAAALRSSAGAGPPDPSAIDQARV